MTHAQGEDVEVGWTANNGGRTNPYVYLEYVNNGADSGPIWQGDIAKNFSYNFRVEDANADGVFIEHFDAITLGHTPDMGWSKGYPATNTERYNSCDDDFAHFDTLRECATANPCSWVRYGKLECLRNDTNTYNWHKSSPSEHYVLSGGSGKCPTNA